MGLKRTLLRIRALDYLISAVAFLGFLILMNLYLTSHLSKKPEIVEHANIAGVKEVQDVPQSGRRVRRAADDSTWSIPADPSPVVLGVPWDCDSPTILDEFPNATCFSSCTSGSCADPIASLQSGNAELVCTARIVQLGFKRTGTYDISRWIKQHRDVTSKTGDMFVDSQGVVIFEECPSAQLHDTSTSYHFDAYSVDSIGSNNQQHYYLHCENCLTSAYTDLYFGSLFLDLPTAMVQFFETSVQKFIVTMKNPTDRAIAEYFYPYIKDGTDLDTVGGQTLHDAMSAAIVQVKACMAELGPAACVFGVIPSSWSSADVLPESAMLYESCYSTHLMYVTQQISTSKIYFMKIEEYQANPAGKMQDLFSFIGLDYLGPVAPPAGGHIHKPILSETVTMMDEFFSPFNAQLSTVLGDSKWLYTRS